MSENTLLINSVPELDLEIRGARSSRPLDKGGGGRSPKENFRPFGPQFGLKMRGGGGGGGGADPSPKSATET